MENKEIFKNNILHLISNSLQMDPWEARQKVREQNYLIQIEYITDKETSETIKDICKSEKNGYTFDEYIYMLHKVLEALSMGIPIDKVLEVIDNRNMGENIYTIIEEYKMKSFKNSNITNLLL